MGATCSASRPATVIRAMIAAAETGGGANGGASGGASGGGGGAGRAGSPKDKVVPRARRDSSDDFSSIAQSQARPLSGLAGEVAEQIARDEERAGPGAPTDPITLTRIKRDSLVFEYRRPDHDGNRSPRSRTVSYRAESLIDYMLATGSFAEPETRLAFSDEDLARIDELGAKLGKPSVLEAKASGGPRYREAAEKRSAFDGLERCAGEVVYQMVRAVEHARDMQDGQLKLVTNVFPQLRYYLGLMFAADEEAAALAANQMRVFFVGPPNHRTRDRTGILIDYCLATFDEMVQEAAAASVQKP